MKKSNVGKSFAGINIQFPISQLILNGQKTIETRTYPIPKKYLGHEMVIIETPGRSGKFKARVVSIIKFEDCFQYTSKEEFYRDTKKHQITPNSPWSWEKSKKKKWGWVIAYITLLKKPIPLKRRSGIVFSKDVVI